MSKVETKTDEKIFINASNLEFKDISSEEYREYIFCVGNGVWFKTRIKNPLYLHVSASGGHRIFDAQGISHYVPYKWFELKWKAKEGYPHFKF